MKNIARKILATSIIFIAGCLNYTQITTLKTDGSGRMFIHYWAKWKTEQDTVLINRAGVFDSSSIAMEFASKFNKISRLEIFKNYADSTIHTQIELEFSDIVSLNNVHAFKGAEFKIEEGPSGTKIFSQFIAPIVTGFGKFRKDINLKYIYYLPGRVLSHNANDLSNNKATWEFTFNELGKGKIISATYRPFKLRETPTWIYILLVIMILTVIIYIFGHRSK